MAQTSKKAANKKTAKKPTISKQAVDRQITRMLTVIFTALSIVFLALVVATYK